LTLIGGYAWQIVANLLAYVAEISYLCSMKEKKIEREKKK